MDFCALSSYHHIPASSFQFQVVTNEPITNTMQLKFLRKYLIWSKAEWSTAYNLDIQSCASVAYMYIVIR